MIIWKPLTRYMKFRDEHAYHVDFALLPGEMLSFLAGEEIEVSETCPEGTMLKVHLEIAVEPFKLEEDE